MISLSTFNLLIWIWIGIALLIFPIQLKVTAPYGRYTQISWGPMIDNRLGWFLMEFPALAVFLYFILSYADFENKIVITASLLWILHYFNRVIIFPFRIRTSGKKMPVIILLFAFIFNLVNASANAYWLSMYLSNTELKGIIWIRLIGGILAFLTGYAINQYHDRKLIRLRKENKNGYKIPYGGLFSYISCPNYFGEILEWGGFTLFIWNLPALSFLVWTIVNLVPRALDHHKWYLEHFTEYPKERKAVIPFLL